MWEEMERMGGVEEGRRDEERERDSILSSVQGVINDASGCPAQECGCIWNQLAKLVIYVSKNIKIANKIQNRSLMYAAFCNLFYKIDSM